MADESLPEGRFTGKGQYQSVLHCYGVGYRIISGDIRKL